MDRFWQWAWDRHAPRYLWVIWLTAFASALPVYLAWAWIVLSFEKSSRYCAAFIVAAAVALVMTAGGAHFPVDGDFALSNDGSRAVRLIGRRHWKTRTSGIARVMCDRWRCYLLRWWCS